MTIAKKLLFLLCWRSSYAGSETKRETSGDDRRRLLRPNRNLDEPLVLVKKKKKKRPRVPSQVWVRQDDQRNVGPVPSSPPSSRPSVDPCSLVRCAYPECLDDAAPHRPPGECCPRCPEDDDEKRGVGGNSVPSAPPSSRPSVDPCSLVRCAYPQCPDDAEPYRPRDACCLRCPDALLNAGDELNSGEVKRVEGAELHVRPDGNVVLYAPSDGGGGRRKLWETGYLTSKPRDAYSLKLQGDGHLLSHDSNDALLWKTDRPGGVTGDYHLALIRDDGDGNGDFRSGGGSDGTPIGMAVRRGTESSPGETLWSTLEPCRPRPEHESSPHSVGSIAALVPDANDVDRTEGRIVAVDGGSGDVDYPHGPIRPLATVGEVDACTGRFVLGRPDGNGAYLVDRDTVRAVAQNESQNAKARPYRVNDGRAVVTGSHVQYVDYDREMLSRFMDKDDGGISSASDMYKGSGELIETFYNVKGEPLGPRNLVGATAYGAHYGNTDPEGNWKLVSEEKPEDGRADWLMRRLCSAHLEEKYQWGDGMGLVDDLYLTNEEDGNFPDDVDSLVGLGAHAIHVETKTLYSLGSFGFGGFEKIVEFRSGRADYVAFAPSGYNGAMHSELTEIIARRNSNVDGRFRRRSDGKDWIKPTNIVPARIYIGKKGYMEDGTRARDESDVLARNGLRYGKLYGFAVDLSETSSSGTKGTYRDEYHKTPPPNGSRVVGKWIAIRWTWDGTVRDFSDDGSVWEWQDDPPGHENRSTYKYWTARGPDEAGKKTEHVAPDLRIGKFGFVAGSTGGYFGHYYATDLDRVLGGLPKDGSVDFPSEIDGEYVYQSNRDASSQILLGGKGLYADGKDATRNYGGSNSGVGTGKFRQIDGLETILVKNGNALHLIVQEDSANPYGERMFLTSELEHANDGKELTYHLVAFSGGIKNARSRAGVGIPSGVYNGDQAHEFSGATDLSGLLSKDPTSGGFVLKPDDTGYVRRKAESDVSVNDKSIFVSLQAGNYRGGVIEEYDLDVGGQWLLYRPNI